MEPSKLAPNYRDFPKLSKRVFAVKEIKEGSLVLRYDNCFDYNKSDKFAPHWEGPFKVLEKFANGSYLRQATSNKGEWMATKAIFLDRKSTRLNSSHSGESRMPSSA